MRIPLGRSAYSRRVAQDPEIRVLNRYFESDPTNQVDQVALIARARLKRLLPVGTGPIRGWYSQPGSFADALFVVSGDTLWRVDGNLALTAIGSGIAGEFSGGTVSMTATDEYLFVADGRLLWVYDGATLTQVAVPDDAGVISVGMIANFVIVVIAQGYGMNGRFYWIEPGDTTIDPLNFATAERSPDPLWNVTVVGDQFWLPGTNTTETWYPTGNPDAPFLRVQGRLFDRGTWEGVTIAIKDTLITVDTDGVVYAIGAAPQRISNSGIEERIRRAMAAQRASGA